MHEQSGETIGKLLRTGEDEEREREREREREIRMLTSGYSL